MSLIVILGPTAIGKTRLSVSLASEIDAEIISADSRQVYKKMDIGTGKDLNEYTIDSKTISHHLIDIKEAGEEYNLFDFQQDFYEAYHKIISKNKKVVLCGGSGLYIETALAKEKMLKVPNNILLRNSLEQLNQEDLNVCLKQLNQNQHNKSDLEDRGRTIRAIEIESFKKENAHEIEKSPIAAVKIFGLFMERDKLRARIRERLEDRLNSGMIEEVEALIREGMSLEKLNYYGLEYRFISQYLSGEYSYDEMFEKLLQAIRRFAKKQMTWYRRMERNGFEIEWINAELPLNEKLEIIQKSLSL